MREIEIEFELQRSEFGQILGLNSPVDEQVLTAAVCNQSYAVNLLLCRETPVFLTQLLANPPAPPPEPIPTAELIKRGADALWRWSRSGFNTVDETVLRRRLEACQACPHLSAPPEGRELLYKLAGTAKGGKGVCRACGCPVTRKASMTFEECPEPHPEIDGLTRWGEPVQAGD